VTWYDCYVFGLLAVSFPVSSPVLVESRHSSVQIDNRTEMTNLFVGNLSFQTTQDDLIAAFSQYGNVERVNIVTDRETGQARGFAFVEMTDRREAETAIARLNGAELNGRAMNVNEARPKPQGGGGGRSGGFGGGGGNRGRGARW
jgi:cold-inducible RNA-binding protein